MTSSFFFFNDTATTEIYTLSLHDALPILITRMLDDAFANFKREIQPGVFEVALLELFDDAERYLEYRSEEHTSELQSLRHLVCRLLLEKKIRQSLHRFGERAVRKLHDVIS